MYDNNCTKWMFCMCKGNNSLLSAIWCLYFRNKFEYRKYISHDMQLENKLKPTWICSIKQHLSTNITNTCKQGEVSINIKYRVKHGQCAHDQTIFRMYD